MKFLILLNWEKESRHNLNCWNQEEYIGFGVAAHSYLNGIRFSNTINVEEYIQHIEDNRKEEKYTNRRKSKFRR